MKSEVSLLRSARLLRVLAAATLALLVLILLVFYNFDHVWDWWRRACLIFADKEKFKVFIKGYGSRAPLVFILFQVLQVVLAPIPGEATGFIGGFLFGVPLGMVYSTIGLTAGSVLAFLIARWFEEHYVTRWLPAEILAKFDFLMEHQGALIASILFLVPGFPKDYLCFILGLGRMPFRLFLVISTIGRLPGTLLLTLQGAKVYEGSYWTTGIILGLCLVLLAVMGYYRESVYAWIRRLDHTAAGEPKKT